ncbi:polysaccharide biosynthesis/export family protein [Mucilaginibacter pallidiroseus]|nr:polysaccharide biosynthesis/export family protein [Mucilaginibacter pallidiroseus]
MKIQGTTKHLKLALLFTVVAFSSCVNTKRLKYFQDMPESDSATPINIAAYTETTIQPDDILAININTIDPQATTAINSRNGGFTNVGVNPQSGTINPVTGYLVDKTGFVDVPIIGRIKLGGLTTLEARDIVRKRATDFFKNPIVDVRFSNFRITVIGEVNKPASYVIPNEQVSLLDAIGYAGDLTVYGKRNNVLLIRKDAAGKNVTVRLDLTKKSTLNSPYFYLKQNDVVYIEPDKSKVQNNDNNVFRYITAGATVFTAIILAIRYL